MAFDTHSLFAYSTVASITSQTTTTIIFNVQPGDGAKFAINQQIVFWPSTNPFPLLSNAMVARITGITTDQITADVSATNREGSNTRTVASGDQVMNGVTPKAFLDIEKQLLAPQQTEITVNTGAFDWSAASIFQRTLDGTNGTLSITNALIGECRMVRLIQDATGGRTVTWPTTVNWQGGIAPVLTTTNGKIDTFGLMYQGSNVWSGFIVGQNE